MKKIECEGVGDNDGFFEMEVESKSDQERLVIFKPCPFCGDEPEIETLGTFIEVSCCAGMSLQKSDVLTIEERETWSNPTWQFSKDAELKALQSIAYDWNKRI